MSSNNVRPCSDCGERGVYARGWCSRCYLRHWHNDSLDQGEPVIVPIVDAADAVERIGWTVTSRGCWLWRGKSNRNGYGILSKRYPGEWFGYLAHRVVYQTRRGRLTPGLELDHTCCRTLCVNPDHLDPVSKQEHSRRTFSRAGFDEGCAQGHPWSESNLIRRSNGRRECRACKGARNDRWIIREKLRAAGVIGDLDALIDSGEWRAVIAR